MATPDENLDVTTLVVKRKRNRVQQENNPPSADPKPKDEPLTSDELAFLATTLSALTRTLCPPPDPTQIDQDWMNLCLTMPPAFLKGRNGLLADSPVADNGIPSESQSLERGLPDERTANSNEMSVESSAEKLDYHPQEYYQAEYPRRDKATDLMPNEYPPHQYPLYVGESQIDKPAKEEEPRRYFTPQEPRDPFPPPPGLNDDFQRKLGYPSAAEALADEQIIISGLCLSQWRHFLYRLSRADSQTLTAHLCNGLITALAMPPPPTHPLDPCSRPVHDGRLIYQQQPPFQSIVKLPARQSQLPPQPPSASSRRRPTVDVPIKSVKSPVEEQPPKQAGLSPNVSSRTGPRRGTRPEPLVIERPPPSEGRFKQIARAKSTPEYILYVTMIPREQRLPNDPLTPKVAGTSWRDFQSEVRQWKRMLHRKAEAIMADAEARNEPLPTIDVPPHNFANCLKAAMQEAPPMATSTTTEESS